MPQKPTKSTPSLVKTIASVLDKSCKVWNAQDYRGLHDLWDPQEPEPWIIAEDSDAPLIGWAVIEAYWQTSLGLAERDDMRYSNLQAKQLDKDLAVAIYTLRFIRKGSGPEVTKDGECRVTAIFRKYNQKWCFCHVAEAPLSPFLLLRRIYENDGGTAPEMTIPKK